MGKKRSKEIKEVSNKGNVAIKPIDWDKHNKVLGNIFKDFFGYGVTDDKETNEVILDIAMKLGDSIGKENKRILEEYNDFSYLNRIELTTINQNKK